MYFKDSDVALSASIMLLAAAFFGLSSFTCAILLSSRPDLFLVTVLICSGVQVRRHLVHNLGHHEQLILASLGQIL
jgi:hypothetical protein